MKADILLDAGPLVAYLDRRDGRHAAARTLLLGVRPPFRTCEAVLTEAAWLLRSLPVAIDAIGTMLRRGAIVVDFSLATEHHSVFALLGRYANVPMSLADACLVRMSELNREAVVLTFDSDFDVYRRFGRERIATIGLAEDG